MQKVVKFLEAYVQWVALGLGILWVLWMGYSYWASNPVVADINNEKVAPGEIEDTLLASTPIDGLDKAYRNEGPYPEQIRTTLQDHSQASIIVEYKKAIGDVTAPESWSPPFPGGVPQQIKLNPTEGIAAGSASLPDIAAAFVLEPGTDGEPTSTGMSVVKRPDPTVPVVVDSRTGQTNVAQQDLLTPPDVSLTNPNGAGNPQPGANPGDPNQPQAAKPIAVVPEEVTWVTVSGTLDMKKLAEAFQKAQIPAPASFTTVLRVELLRQELQPNGNWSNEETVKDLTNQFKPQFPNGENADQTLQAAYRDWAKQHVADVVEPAFYEVLRGMFWKTAAMPDLAAANNANAQQANFDPATFPPGKVSTLPPEQRAQWLKWKQDKDKQDAQQHRPKAPSTPAGGYGPGRGGLPGGEFFAPPAGPDPAMIERYRQQAQQRSQQQQPPARPPVTGGEVPFDATMPGSYQPGMQQPNAPQAQQLPPAPFSPAQQNKDLEVWAHDETTVPGKIYRYKLRIFISNPMWGTQGMAKNQNDASVFALKTETEWTKPINSPSKRDFFVTNGGTSIGGVPKVGVDYFKWEDGEWKKDSVSVQPGDRIGETPWTVADIRPVGSANNENRVLLVNDDGSLTSRYYKTDKARKEYKNLLDKVKPATPPPGAPGTPAPGFGAAFPNDPTIPTAPGGARGGH